ncbi:MAG: flagellar hook-length control protein FliK [Planctomycetota bacterium]
MGPQLFPTDTIGRLTADLPARIVRRPDNPESTFEKLLDEARSGRAPLDEPAEQPAKLPAETDDIENEDDSGRIEDADETRPAEEQGQPSDPSTVTKPLVLSSGTDVIGAGRAEAVATNASPSTDTTGTVSSPATVPETGESKVRQQAAATVPTDAAKATHTASLQAASDADGRVSPESLTGAPAKPGSSATPSSAMEAVPVTEERQPQLPGQAAGEQASSGRHNRNPQHGPETNTAHPDRPVGTANPAVKTERGGDEPSPLLQQETIQQRKVRMSIEQRQQGGTREQNPGSPQHQPVEVQSQSGRAVYARLQTLSSSDAAQKSPTSLSIRSATGDDAAAAISRFMLSGFDGSGQSDGASAPAARSASATQAGLSLPGTATASGVLTTGAGEALAAGVDGIDDLSGAARVLRASQGGGQFHVTMQLDPPEMGQLKVQIRMHQQAMTLQVEAQSQAVAKLIESRMSELRETLASHGIRMDRTEVVVKPPASGEANTSGRDNASSGSTNQEQGDVGQPGERDDGAGGSPDARDDSDAAARLETAEGIQASSMEEGAAFDGTATTELSLDLVA